VCDNSGQRPAASGQRPILHFRSKRTETSHFRRAVSSTINLRGAARQSGRTPCSAPLPSRNSLGYAASGRLPQSAVQAEIPTDDGQFPVSSSPPGRHPFFAAWQVVFQDNVQAALDDIADVIGSARY
jgi:hypothetical protein